MRTKSSGLAIAAAAVCLLLPSGAGAQSAPDPGGDANADLRGLHRPGQLFGFAGIRQRDDIPPATAAEYVAQVNGNATRTAIHWQALEPEQDDWAEPEFERYRQLYAALRARGITPIFVLQFAPYWAREAGTPQSCGKPDICHYPPADSMLPEWREFVTEIASRFGEAAIEVWNEPNYRGQWQPAPDPSGYAELLAVADEAAAAVDPAIPVYAGGLGTDVKDDWIAPASFLGEGLAASPSLEGHTDALNFHAYPTSDLGPGSKFAETFESIRRIRERFADRPPLLISELGASTTGPGAVSARVQGENVLAAVRKVMTMRDTLGALIYSLTDRPQERDPAERGFGTVIATPGLIPGSYSIEPKLAYCMLRSAARSSLPGCPPDTRIASSGAEVAARRQVRFTSPDGVSFECSLDGVQFQRCVSPAPLPAVAPGSHHFQVRAVGLPLLAGTDPAPADVEFEIGLSRLSARVKPANRTMAAGGAPKRFAVTVQAPGATSAVGGVTVCLRANPKLVKPAGERCRPAKPIGPGAETTTKLRLGLKPRAAGKTTRVQFEASAVHSHPSTVSTTVKGR